MHSSGKTKPHRRLRILVVDDNIDQVHTIAYLLKDRGHHVDYAINGIVALDLAQRTKPEVVLLDVKLPDTSGLELARQFRRNPELKGVRIIGITATPLSSEDALAAGFDELHKKPLDPRLLDALLEQR
ncbi:MAG TPA: response regulator [Burkholderiales bacterium]|nr:response regulator [Burkholderiales bacterium]